jgi:uncharacterized membrane protein
MPFCASCGSNVDGKFCPKCGTAVGAAAPGPSAPPPPRPPGHSIDASGIPSNVASLLCYIIPVVCPIIFLVVDPYKTDRKIRFDAFQSLFLTIGFVAIGIAVGILTAMSWRLSATLSPLVSLAELILIVFLAFKAFQNEKVILPIIGPIAEKQV